MNPTHALSTFLPKCFTPLLSKPQSGSEVGAGCPWAPDLEISNVAFLLHGNLGGISLYIEKRHFLMSKYLFVGMCA